MAAQSAARTVHATLTAATADQVSLTGGGYDYIEVVNRSATGAGLSVAAGTGAGAGFSGAARDGVATVAGARTLNIPAGRSRLIPLGARTPATSTLVCSIISATADAYSVTGHSGIPQPEYADRTANA